MGKNKLNLLVLLPVFLWIICIPLIEKLKLLFNPLRNDVWYSNDEYLSDIFLYYKSIAIVLLACVMIVFLMISILRYKRKIIQSLLDMRIFIPAVFYLGLTIISSCLSGYKYFCIHGMPGQFESIWVITAYIIALLYGYSIITWQEDNYITILKYIFIGAALVGLLCVLQYFGLDIYQWIQGNDTYTYTFEKGTVYGSFYSPNYVGFYVALLLPVFIAQLLYAKKRICKYASTVVIAALIIAIIGAHSLSVFIALAAVFFFGIIFMLCKYLPRKRYLRFPLIICGCFICVVGIVGYPRIHAYIESCNTEKHDLNSIVTLDDSVEIIYKGLRLSLRMSTQYGENIIEVHDQNKKPVNLQQVTSDEGYTYYSFSDDSLHDLTIAPVLMTQSPDRYGFAIFLDDKNWCFTNQLTDDDTYYYYTDTGKLTKLTSENKSADFTPLVDKSSLANGRGYIWNKTIALLQDYIFIGSGQDTFAMVYPNYDIVDRFNNGYGSLYTSRPHSLYLQIAIQSGFLSLICFLIFYGCYIISSVRIYYKTAFNNDVVILGFSIMLGTLGYMIMGLTNDSTVTVAPVYWMLLGIGIGINSHIKARAN